MNIKFMYGKIISISRKLDIGTLRFKATTTNFILPFHVQPREIVKLLTYVKQNVPSAKFPLRDSWLFVSGLWDISNTIR